MRFQKYVIYYTKDPDADLADWSTKTVDGEERTAVIGKCTNEVEYKTDYGPSSLINLIRLFSQNCLPTKRSLNSIIWR